MAAVPDGYEDLLVRPLYGDLATVRLDGDPTVTPMWFGWDGELLRFTHTTKRQKLAQIAHNPRVAFSIIGITPTGFSGEAPGESPDIWTSMALQTRDRREDRGFEWLYLMGRLKPGMTRGCTYGLAGTCGRSWPPG